MDHCASIRGVFEHIYTVFTFPIGKALSSWKKSMLRFWWIFTFWGHKHESRASMSQKSEKVVLKKYRVYSVFHIIFYYYFLTCTFHCKSIYFNLIRRQWRRRRRQSAFFTWRTSTSTRCTQTAATRPAAYQLAADVTKAMRLKRRAARATGETTVAATSLGRPSSSSASTSWKPKRYLLRSLSGRQRETVPSPRPGWGDRFSPVERLIGGCGRPGTSQYLFRRRVVLSGLLKNSRSIRSHDTRKKNVKIFWNSRKRFYW